MIELNNNSKKYGSSNLEIEKYLRKKGISPDKDAVREGTRSKKKQKEAQSSKKKPKEAKRRKKKQKEAKRNKKKAKEGKKQEKEGKGNSFMKEIEGRVNPLVDHCSL